jgi:hypothetical protein
VEPFKNLLSPAVARQIGKAVGRAHADFDFRRYARGLNAELEPLELKARMHAIADRLEAYLPSDPEQLYPILIGALEGEGENSGGLKGFPVWPLTEIVARRGLKHFAPSMQALEAMTRCFTAEFAIRPFLRDAPARARSPAGRSPFFTEGAEHVGTGHGGDGGLPHPPPEGRRAFEPESVQRAQAQTRRRRDLDGGGMPPFPSDHHTGLSCGRAPDRAADQWKIPRPTWV